MNKQIYILKIKLQDLNQKIRFLLFLLSLFFFISGSRAESSYFRASDLSQSWVYYYPEHWPENQWERDFKNIAELGFEGVHMGEFAWAQLEPEEGRYHFEWLDKAINLADKYQLKVILCTSTATPPVWMSRKYPEILIKHENGNYSDHGARQHASFSSPIYRELALKTIEVLAKRYGSDPRVIGWQLDNEPSVQFDYNPAAAEEFRTFLKNKYETIDALNQAWGTAFWSQLYNNFDQINIPLMKQQFMNHHQILDYLRFAAQQTAGFLDMQSRCLKKHITVQQFVTTNYIPNYEEGHIGLCKELDFHSYTRYMVFGENKGLGRKGFRVGEPLRIAYANDFFRPIDNLYGVMELQPGQVNWGSINSQPLPGAVRLWLWSVFSGGSQFVCTYRYRQPLFGTEQYHAGIVGSDGLSLSSGGEEFCTYMQELELLRKQYTLPRGELDYPSKAAILYNHENAWSIRNQKQNQHWDTQKHILSYYSALKSFGSKVDVINESANFSDYTLMLAPAYQMIDDELVERWKKYTEAGGHLVLTSRTGHKNRNGALFEAEFGEKINELSGAEMLFYDLLPPEAADTVCMGTESYVWYTWGEVFEPAVGTEVWAEYRGDFYSGRAAVLHKKQGKGSVTYVGVDSRDAALEKAVLSKLYERLGLNRLDLPPGIVVEYRDNFGIAMNYSNYNFEFPLPAEAEVLIGEQELGTTSVLIWKLKK
ncbi:MAG: beta-galactosidase [Bacteroidales bacterium]|nr:beta-galactosidase [Bacteroidales bacterium]